MAFEDFAANSILDKITLVEIKVGKELTWGEWTQTASGSNSWWIDFDPAYDGEIVQVQEDGEDLAEVAHVDLLEESGAEGSWFYDFDAKRLYIRTSDSDDPGEPISGEYKYCVIAYFWACFTNRQPTDSPVVYTPQDADNPAYYLPLLDEQTAPSVSQAIGDFYIGSIEAQSGNIGFTNDGWWWLHIVKGYYWHNCPVYIKIGAKGADYDDFETIFYGATRDPDVSDERVNLGVQDIRISELVKIPLEFYSVDDYPNLDPSAEGRPIPIAFGELEGLTPVCIDTTIYKYKICGHAVNEITTIYLDGIELNSGEYTLDEANGQFTLDDDPGSVKVTCDIQGIAISYFGGGAAYSENVADILYYVLHVLNEIPDVSLDQTSFDVLRAARTQKIAWYIDSLIDTMDFVRILQQSALFHLLPMLTGKYGVFYFTTGESGLPQFRNEDIAVLSLLQKTDACFKTVRVKYKKNFTTNEWLATDTTEEKAEWRYRVKGTLEIETALIDKNEAEILAEIYLLSVRAPQKEIGADLPPLLLNRIPTEKFIISKTVRTLQEEIDVFEDEVYRILSLDKDLGWCRAQTRAVDDVQITGSIHADIEHSDSHEDTHEDTAHDDAIHRDHQDDGGHSDVAHSDSHSDSAHQDTHGDQPYLDIHSDHTDGGHADYSHSDHVDVHTDVPYSDSHGDTAHDDEGSYTDHADREHGDSEHADEHSDSHGDTPHSDSEY